MKPVASNCSVHALLPQAGVEEESEASHLVRQEPIWSQNASPVPFLRGRALESGGMMHGKLAKTLKKASGGAALPSPVSDNPALEA